MIKILLLILLLIPINIGAEFNYPYPYILPPLPYKLYIVGHNSYGGITVTKGQALAIFTGQMQYLNGKRVKLIVSTGANQSPFCFGFLNTTPSSLKTMLDRMSSTGKMTEPIYVNDAAVLQTVLGNVNSIGFTNNPAGATILLELQ